MSEVERFQLQLQAQVITRGTTSKSEVALTFDDGPGIPYTLRILDILHFYSAQATFCCLGRNVEQFPKVVERTQKEGHLVQNHGWSHQALTQITDPQKIS